MAKPTQNAWVSILREDNSSDAAAKADHALLGLLLRVFLPALRQAQEVASSLRHAPPSIGLPQGEQAQDERQLGTLWYVVFLPSQGQKKRQAKVLIVYIECAVERNE